MKNGILLLLIGSLVLITGCSSGSLHQAKIAVICTSALKPQSELIFLDKTGKQLHSIPIQAQGIFSIEQLPVDRLALPVMYSDEMILIDLNKTTAEIRKTKQYPIFYEHLGDAEFIIYNSDIQGDIDYLTYDLIRNSAEKSLRIKGFPLATTIVLHKVYIYLDKKGESDSILQLDLHDFRVEREIPLDRDLEGVSDLLFADNKLLIPHPATHELVILPLQSPKEMTAIELPYATPRLLLEKDHQLIIVHYNGGISFLNQETYQVEGSTQLPYRILQAQLHDNQIYLLVKDDQTQRKIVVLDPDEGNVMQIIEVQCDKDLLLQNFLVLE